MPGFYIHYADPGFPEPPWPGVRRTGPYVTRAQARAQAASDVAIGIGTPLGICDEKGSLAAADADEDHVLDCLVTTEEIQGDADAIVKDAMRAKVKAQAENESALQSQLDDAGLTIDDLQKGVTR